MHSQAWALGVPHLHFSHVVVQLEGAVTATGVPCWIGSHFEFLVSSNRSEWGHSATCGLAAAGGCWRVTDSPFLSTSPGSTRAPEQVLAALKLRRQTDKYCFADSDPGCRGKPSHCPEIFLRSLACDRVSVWGVMMWMCVTVRGETGPDIALADKIALPVAENEISSRLLSRCRLAASADWSPTVLTLCCQSCLRSGVLDYCDAVRSLI